jgi:hypothetical protein
VHLTETDRAAIDAGLIVGDLVDAAGVKSHRHHQAAAADAIIELGQDLRNDAKLGQRDEVVELILERQPQ